MRTIFSTPIVVDILNPVARFCRWLLRWKFVGEPPPADKYVIIAAPHTSNWDFIMFLLFIIERRLALRWMGKHTLFKWPMGGLMRWLGGIPIERSTNHNTVQQMVDAFAEPEPIVLVITPEGTRSKVEKWKTGFYHIAVAADVPISQGFLDKRVKQCGFGPWFKPSGDLEEELPRIQAFYDGMQGLRKRD